jgi:uncharacterized protein (DUF952 family)
MPTIYKIGSASLWRAAEKAGVFHGSEDDRRDGFIHFSTADQVEETAAKHFAGQADLLLIAVDSAKLGDALKWEPSRGGALFPHLYGARCCCRPSAKSHRYRSVTVAGMSSRRWRGEQSGPLTLR